MNFIRVFKDGEAGKNQGLPTGLDRLDRSIDRIQRSAIYGIAAAPKVGKSTFVDFCFVINPYLYAVENNVDIDFIYYSLEMNRTKLEYKTACHFFYADYGITTFEIPGVKVDGLPMIQMSPRYLLHKLRDDNNNIINVLPDHKRKLQEIYERRIIPMYGEYDMYGKKIRKGKIEVIEDKKDSNPTGIRNYLLDYAAKNGTFIEEKFTMRVNGNDVEKSRITGYKPNNPSKYIVVILDHMRKMKKERGFTIKENIDKVLEYQVWLRNICGFTFVDVLHLNRSMSDIRRIQFNRNYLYPNNSDLKDSGNLSEDADFLITLFNPNDDRYQIETHFDLNVKNYPNYRSIHLVESRDTPAPAHIQTNMYANISRFEQI